MTPLVYLWLFGVFVGLVVSIGTALDGRMNPGEGRKMVAGSVFGPLLVVWGVFCGFRSLWRVW